MLLDKTGQKERVQAQLSTSMQSFLGAALRRHQRSTCLQVEREWQWKLESKEQEIASLTARTRQVSQACFSISLAVDGRFAGHCRCCAAAAPA